MQQRMNTALNAVAKVDPLHKRRIESYIGKEVRYAQKPPPKQGKRKDTDGKKPDSSG